MSTQYQTEPPPTATVVLHTTAGPLTLSLFAQQTPLTCRNFLQHVLDGYYDGVLFHRVSPGFVIQTGDPTGTGEGGETVYEDGDKNLERYDETWSKMLKMPEERYGERIKLGDEIHSRLKFNRRGLVGMASMGDGERKYGSQFFITLADCRAELDGKCTMFGRVEGEGIYNVVKIAEGELVEGTERPMYPEKIIRAEVVEMPTGEGWQVMKKRERIAQRTMAEDKSVGKKKAMKKKGGKALLSFGGGDGDEEDITIVKPKKAKFNTALIDGPLDSKSPEGTSRNEAKPGLKARSPSPTVPQKRKASESHGSSTSPPAPNASVKKPRQPSFHEPTTQLPIRDPESPSRSPTPSPQPSKHRRPSQKSASALEEEIAALKASMRRDVAPAPEAKKKLSALEAMIPATSTRGRKRPRPGDNTTKDDDKSLKLLNAFKARLEGAEENKYSRKAAVNGSHQQQNTSRPGPEAPDEEATLCDLHFIANCQSCSDWADDSKAEAIDDSDKKGFLNHLLTFEKDRLGKDLTWKRKNEEELVVIDPRERERELGIKPLRDKGKRADGGGGREWDSRRDVDTRQRDRKR